MVNRERLAEDFMALVRIDSLSRKEGRIAQTLSKRFKALGAQVLIDGAAQKVGGETGNLIAKLEGTHKAIPPLLVNAHMDTVKPGEGVAACLQDGVFSSDGTTVLGADDKSALAIIVETLKVLQENKLPHGPLEIVLTVCEEIGLLGAKALDFPMLRATYGFTLDGRDTDGIVIRAPACNHMTFTVVGLDAHAGAAPDKGVNAIQLACRAIANMSLGRIDDETTANIGLIEGGKATNIVPDRVVVSGEVRSHSLQRLDATTERIRRCFEDEIVAFKTALTGHDGVPRLETAVRRDFPLMYVPEDHRIVALAKTAASHLGRAMLTKSGGGGSDANIFFEQGIVMGILGTGMTDVHSVRESIRLDDMVKTVELLVEIIQTHYRENLS
jgi:tripeptide aminopeptidase